MDEVKSSNVSRCGFCCDSCTLAVTFKSGQTYHYHGLTPEDHKGLMEAEGFGKHMNTHIKGKFKFTKPE